MALALSEYELEALPELELENELEGELEGELESHELHELEFEGEISPVRKYYVDAMLEHMGHVAAEAQTEQEAAEGFLPLIPMLAAKALPLAAKFGAKMLPKLAGKVLPKVAKVFNKVTPRLTRGVGRITRGLHRNPRTRPLVRTMPTIARRTVATIARRAATGRPVTPRLANRVLVAQTRRVLRNPRQTAQVLRRSRTLERHFHRANGGAIQPHRRLPGVISQAVNGVPMAGYPMAGAPMTGVAMPGGGPAMAAGGARYGTCLCPPCAVAAAPVMVQAAAPPPVPAVCPACGR